AGLPVHHDLGRRNLPLGLKDLAERVIRGAEREITDVQLLHSLRTLPELLDLIPEPPWQLGPDFGALVPCNPGATRPGDLAVVWSIAGPGGRCPTGVVAFRTPQSEPPFGPRPDQVGETQGPRPSSPVFPPRSPRLPRVCGASSVGPSRTAGRPSGGA